jgi:hypothetical protein
MTNGNRTRESDQRRMKELAEKHPKLFRGLLMPWFTAEGYVKMRAAAADKSKLIDTFEEFEQAASARFDQAVSDGHPVEKVVIDADRLIACKEEGRPLDAMARQTFAAMTVIENDGRGGRA